jgi:serine/threonine protein kinase
MAAFRFLDPLDPWPGLTRSTSLVAHEDQLLECVDLSAFDEDWVDLQLEEWPAWSHAAANAPAVARLHTVDRAERTACFHFVPRVSMSALVTHDKEARGLAPGLVCSVLEDVARGVCVLHDGMREPHRSITPDTTWMTLDGRGYLTWGTTHARPRTTRTGAPRWVWGEDSLSPEQLFARDVSVSTDVWSLGVVAFFALSAHSPFRGDNMFRTFENIIKTVRPRLQEVRGDLPDEVVAPVEQMVQPRADQRPTMPEVAERLAALPAWLRWSPEQRADELRAIVPQLVEREARRAAMR